MIANPKTDKKHGGRAPKAETPDERVIVTKHRIFRLPANTVATPVEDYFVGVQLPEPLKSSGAKVYDTADGPVIAVPTVKRRTIGRKPTP